MSVVFPNGEQFFEGTQGGFFYDGGSQITGLFDVESSWYFFVGKAAFKVHDIKSINRTYETTGEANLDINLKYGRIIKVDYRVCDKIPGDPTPFLEDEDFDYGLFFENLVLDENRLRRISEARFA